MSWYCVWLVQSDGRGDVVSCIRNLRLVVAGSINMGSVRVFCYMCIDGRCAAQDLGIPGRCTINVPCLFCSSRISKAGCKAESFERLPATLERHNKMNSLMLAALCHLAVLAVLSAVARLASTALISLFVRCSRPGGVAAPRSPVRRCA